MPRSNFDFLQPEFSFLFENARHAEQHARSAPRSSCFYARFTLEQAVHWLYDNDSYLRRPYEDNLGSLIHESSFRQNLKPNLFPKVLTIHKLGNRAAHDEQAPTTRDALRSTEELFHFLYWLSRSYTQHIKTHPSVRFDASLMPSARAERDLNVQQVHNLQQQLAEREQALKARDEELEQLRALVQQLKTRNAAVPDDHDYNEADTRRYFIDLLLKEAGWLLNRPEDREYEVSGMPNQTGKGYVDYVLWGKDGKPLAIVEAKRTRKDPHVGQQQAKLYADCLEQQFGQRPLIYYTNGYETRFWDDERYPPRLVSGYFKRDELELAIQRRLSLRPLSTAPVNKTIAGRHYQIGAIQHVCNTFASNKRHALLVMATGTGKTRTAIALTELLQKANWVKRVLFLADRNALLAQAGNAYKNLLPTVTPTDLTKEKEHTTSRLLLSTYPTMMNLIDDAKAGIKRFGPGYFDLIIIDEAHRSVYHKYRAIFEYFDSLLLGLTATPRDEIDRNTYRLFGLKEGMPTFAYELDEAIQDGFLVPPRAVSVPLKFQREGIRYDDLSEDEQLEYEVTFYDDETGDVPDHIDASALNKWLFNTDTVDRVLMHLMENGIKVDGGDTLGKTIIFAKNHKHAVFIQERFDVNYPHLKGQFARVIDSHDTYAQSLLEDFTQASSMPQIAISVDMLDTGIDIPEIVNLVYFKLVRSRTKFHQMLGRGTRLRRICSDRAWTKIVFMCSISARTSSTSTKTRMAQLPQSLNP